MFLPRVINIFAFWTKILVPKHIFPSLDTMKAMLTSFQCCSLKMFLSKGERTTMADREVEADEPQAGHRKGEGRKERNWKNEERVLLTV